MAYRSEIMLPHDSTTEAVTLFDIAKMIPLEEQVELRNFLRGTRYGLDMADALHRLTAHHQAEQTQTRT